jgi:hypothetical protein
MALKGLIDGLLIEASEFRQYNSSGALLWHATDVGDVLWYADTGTATQGALVASMSVAGGTDSFGNTYYKGLCTYNPSAGVISQVIAGSFSIGTDAQIGAEGQNAGQAPGTISDASGYEGRLAIFSGQVASEAQSIFTMFSADSVAPDRLNSGVTEIDLTAAYVNMTGNLGVSGNVNASGQMNATNHITAGTTVGASQGFVLNDSWHYVTMASGLSGYLRVMLLPWNGQDMVVMEGDFQGFSAGTTYTLGGLPSSAYYPNPNLTTNRHFPVGATGGSNARLYVPTSGSLQLVSGGSGTISGSVSAVYAST